MEVNSSRFGMLSIDEDSIITFPRGLPAFEETRSFFVLNHSGGANLMWLHSADNPELALLVIDPFLVFAGYEPDIPDESLAEIGVKCPEDALVLAVVSVRGHEGKADGSVSVTANLAAPIVISRSRRQGEQVVLRGTEYSTRHGVVGCGKHDQVAGE
ncbi:MAG: flagellar assembly protein FliW [Clostridia bacterium]|nr:flagellar assembly protein FliW [Clostridia bacterium]